MYIYFPTVAKNEHALASESFSDTKFYFCPQMKDILWFSNMHQPLVSKNFLKLSRACSFLAAVGFFFKPHLRTKINVCQSLVSNIF